MKKVVFTGDRDDWPHYRAALLKVFKELKNVHRKRSNPYLVLVGDCTGVDTLVVEYAEQHKIPYQIFYADWDKYGRAAGPIRNKAMLDERPIMVVACHKDLHLSKGTRDCVSQAEKLGIPVKRIGHWPF